MDRSRLARVRGLRWLVPLSVVVGLVAFLVVPNAVGRTGGPVRPATLPHKITFHLFPNKQFLGCSQEENQTAKATVTVIRGKQVARLTLHLKGFQEDVGYDLFTVQNSPQLANGDPDPNFTNFGMAWYQADFDVASTHAVTVKIKTILLDEAFGFDPAANLGPTNTFHVGFWFDDPSVAAPCGFTGPPTPFNGTHDAGPVAFISRPDATTGLGPLCTNPDTSTNPPTCKA
jgi:hypothetical protein